MHYKIYIMHYKPNAHTISSIFSSISSLVMSDDKAATVASTLHPIPSHPDLSDPGHVCCSSDVQFANNQIFFDIDNV